LEVAEAVELDAFDRRLLELLQQDSRRTGKELAALVGLSAPACLRRVQRLRETGVIEREIAIVSPRYLGRRVTMIVLLTIERDRPDRMRLFTAAMCALPEVTQCYTVTGDADYVLTVVVPDMEAYAQFTERHFYEPYVKRFETIVVLSDAMRP
jgi:Lrp/AsnC family transcriptional regulator, leucine-responsive regulatory protein